MKEIGGHKRERGERKTRRGGDRSMRENEMKKERRGGEEKRGDKRGEEREGRWREVWSVKRGEVTAWNKKRVLKNGKRKKKLEKRREKRRNKDGT